MSDEDKNIIDKLNDSVSDLIGKILGDKGDEMIEKAQASATDIANWTAKMFLSIVDSVAEQLEMKDNEYVEKTREALTDMLKKAGLLEEE